MIAYLEYDELGFNLVLVIDGIPFCTVSMREIYSKTRGHIDG